MMWFKRVNKRNLISTLVGIVVMAVVSMLSTSSYTLPGILNLIFIYSIAALALNIVCGCLGEFVLGHGGFLLAGYTTAVLIVKKFYSFFTGAEFRKIFGVTNEFVDIKSIEDELSEIQVPMICSPQSFDIYSTTKTICTYRADIPVKPLYINDMGVISPLMVITPDCIVSSNLAKSVEEAKDKGFMFFVDYVLKGECKLGGWDISFKNKEFKIYYTSKHEDIETTELLYQAFELDKTATYKLVLYIIKKVANTFEEYKSDNFVGEVWVKNRE